MSQNLQHQITLKVSKAFAELLFRGIEPEPPAAPSKTFEVKTESGRTVTLRQWISTDPPDEKKAKSPVLLLVHGLGGCSEWMSPMAAKLLEKQDLVFGIDIPRIGRNPTGIGDFADRRDLVKEVTETVQHLAAEHKRPVYALGLSLGGLLVTHMAANPPKELSGIIVASPAYRAATATFKPMIYVKAIFKRMLEKCWILKKSTIAIPYAEDQTSVTRNPEKRKMIHETPDRVNFLTSQACVQLIKLTLLDTPKTSQKIHLPVIMFVAQQDKICDPQAMVDAFEKFPSKDKRVFILPESMHDVVLDPEMPLMANAINEWLAGRALGLKAPEASAKPEILVQAPADPEKSKQQKQATEPAEPEKIGPAG